MNDNVHPFPEREDMPPEFAAIGLPGDGDGVRIVINTSETRPGDTFRWLLRPQVILPLLVASVIKWSKEHPLPAMSSALAAGATAGAIVIAPLTDVRSEPPPLTVVTPTATPNVIVVTPSPSPIPMPTKSWRPAKPTVTPATSGEEPQRTSEPEPAPSPARSSKKPSSSRPGTTTPPTVDSTTLPNADTGPSADTTALPSSDTEATTTATEASKPPSLDPETDPPLTSSGRDCSITLDLDWLGNLCVLP